MSIPNNIKPTRIALITLVLCLIASAMLGIMIVLIGDFGERQIKILGTVTALAGFSLISLPSLFNLERQQYQLVAKPGIFAGLIFFLLILIIIWGSGDFGNEIMGKSTFSAGVVGFGLNHILLLFIVKPRAKALQLIQKFTSVTICFVACILIGTIWVEEMPDPLFRILITLVILDVLGTISLPILSRITFNR
ncbi:MAG: hypothetical protein CL904_05895 [Dehalococcoidia bacterium]|nr:hypothetical protein [Dehalococcoidia bacterium]MQG15273.1 hypothetical protein [SAR202 cluster bacterium]